MPASVIGPASARWLKDQGFQFADSLEQDSAHWSFNWGKSYISIYAYSYLPDTVTRSPSWLKEIAGSKKDNHIELTFYPSEDSIEIAFAHLGDKYILEDHRMQKRLNELAVTLNTVRLTQRSQ